MSAEGQEFHYYSTVIEAIRAAAEQYGNGAYKQLSFAIPVDEWPIFHQFIQKHGKEKLLEILRCQLAEVK